MNQVREEEPEPEQTILLEQSDWMDCAQQQPKTKNKSQKNLEDLADKDFDWNSIRKKYNKNQLETMQTWLLNKKTEEEINEIIAEENVNPDNLNKYQRFAYDLVKDFQDKQNQLLMILLGNIYAYYKYR